MVLTMLAVDDTIFISDRGLTLCSLAEEISIDDQEIREAVENIMDYYEDIEVSGNELRIAIDDYENVVSGVMRLFVTMDIIYRIGKSIIKERKKKAIPENPIYLKALFSIVRGGTASASFIQRNFHVGYNMAVKILEWMESMGFVSSSNGGRTRRRVLLTKEEFVERYGKIEE